MTRGEILVDKVHKQYSIEEEKAVEDKVFGFWLYLMSDCIMFAVVFATYVVLTAGIADGPSGKEIFNLSFVFAGSMFLLVSSLAFGFAMVAQNNQNKKRVIYWLIMTFILGAGFVGLELYEFHELIAEGNGPQKSGFLSAFFLLVGLHGLHVFVGLLWIIVMIIQVLVKGLSLAVKTRLTCLSLFWHFLDLIWICVFSIVYLMGMI